MLNGEAGKDAPAVVDPWAKAVASGHKVKKESAPKEVWGKFEAGKAELPADLCDPKVSGSGGKKKKGYGPTGPNLPRTRISSQEMYGQIIDWKGKYGWLMPLEPFHHSKLRKHGGRIYVNQVDNVGLGRLNPGVFCKFHVYEDDDGLGAEDCSVVDFPGNKALGKWGKGLTKGDGRARAPKGGNSRPCGDGSAASGGNVSSANRATSGRFPGAGTNGSCSGSGAASASKASSGAAHAYQRGERGKGSFLTQFGAKAGAGKAAAKAAAPTSTFGEMDCHGAPLHSSMPSSIEGFGHMDIPGDGTWNQFVPQSRHKELAAPSRHPFSGCPAAHQPPDSEQGISGVTGLLGGFGFPNMPEMSGSMAGGMDSYAGAFGPRLDGLHDCGGFGGLPRDCLSGGFGGLTSDYPIDSFGGLPSGLGGLMGAFPPPPPTVNSENLQHL